MTAIVVDASAIVEFVRGTRLGGVVHARMRRCHVNLPHLYAVEVVSALRGLARAHKIPPRTAVEAVSALALLRAERYPVEPFLARIWQLQHNLTASDATYVTLAESLGATLLTVDARFDTPVVRRLITVDVVR